MRTVLKALGVAGLLTLAGLAPGWTAGEAAEAGAEKAAPTLDAAMRQEADKILRAVRGQGYRNVGVLKFLVRGEGGEPTDNAGRLNYSLPDRLEVALVLALDPDASDDRQTGVITRTNAVVEASGNRKVNHLTAEGREAFYRAYRKESPFRKAWGNETIPVDDNLAFLTGEVTVARDLRSMRVRVYAFGPRDPRPFEPVLVDDFTAAVDLRTLGDVGVTYTTRGAKIKDVKEASKSELADLNDKTAVADASNGAVQVGDDKESWARKGEAALKVLEESPVKLEIRYTRPGQAPEVVRPGVNPARPPSEFDWVLLRTRPPVESEQVSFVLRNTGSETYGVVLRVNGRNTIYPDQDLNAADVDSYKWVLEPGKTTEVKGWQKSRTNVEPFLVLAESQSRKDEVRYGERPGTLSLSVFKVAGTETEKKLADADKEKPPEQLSISRGAQALQAEVRPQTLAALQSGLKGDAGKAVTARGTRGLIGGTGEEKPNPVKEERLKWNPLPLEQVVIRYYTPRE
jgi:hypothetical protein